MGLTASKPLDLGTGAVCASFDPGSAAWLSLGTPHPAHGFVELTAMPPFDEARRGDAEATRRYRWEMTLPAHAFLAVEIAGARPRLEPDVSDPTIVRWAGGGTSVVANVGVDEGTIEQRWTLERDRAGRGPTVRLRLRGRIDRPALAEITETDPPPPTHAETVVDLRDSVAQYECPILAAHARVAVRGATVAWQADARELVGTISWPAGTREISFSVAVSLPGPETNPAVPRVTGLRSGDRLVDRALTYIRGCTALRVGPGERVMLTDHRILPLSWTRDAYWQALALLAADGPGDRERVADHLRWLWRRCERPDGRWVRSHHANGRRKDLAFQADQQLYPFLELADYWRATGSLPDGVAWNTEVARAWKVVRGGHGATAGFIPSAENAADDPAPAPFIASSQILLWYVAERMRELVAAGAVGGDDATFADVARAVRDSFAQHFAADGGSWPYAVDLAGGRVTYHDANDLPIALAPLWGFCQPADEGWLATMAFAFSGANPAWVEGDPPGLGSAHTPGRWSLGDLQAWIGARATANVRALQDAQQRLDDMAFADGMLPETIGPEGEPVRHWFAWPGATFAALCLLDRQGRLHKTIGIAPPLD